MGIKLVETGVEFIDVPFQDELKDFSKKVIQRLLMYSTTKAKEIEGYMKRNRPWTDRTGEAKRRLGTAVDYTVGDKEITISLYHGVNYGISLEMKHECKYAIIKPTIQHFSPIIMNDLQDLLSD